MSFDCQSIYRIYQCHCHFIHSTGETTEIETVFVVNEFKERIFGRDTVDVCLTMGQKTRIIEINTQYILTKKNVY